MPWLTSGPTTATVTTGTKAPFTTQAPETKPPVPINENFVLNDVLKNYENEEVHPGTQDKITFSSHWGLSQNYYTRFVGGDEHWTVLSRVGANESATCTVTFFGNAIEVFCAGEFEEEFEVFNSNDLLTTIGELTGSNWKAYYEDEGQSKAFESIKDQTLAEGKTVVIVLE